VCLRLSAGKKQELFANHGDTHLPCGRRRGVTESLFKDFSYLLKKEGKRSEGWGDLTVFYDETFGTVTFHPQNIGKIRFLCVPVSQWFKAFLVPACPG
jgi:hypothetical protein